MICFIIFMAWYLIGFVSMLFTNAYINKLVYGYWYFSLGELIESIFFGFLGLLVFIACSISCLKWFIENNVDLGKEIWTKK